jgi:hypothetical protein
MEIGYLPPTYGPVTLYEDNQGCMALAINPTYHARTKHIDIRYHFIWHAVEVNAISLTYCYTDHMLADIFTKALPANRLQYLCKMMGLYINYQRS